MLFLLFLILGEKMRVKTMFAIVASVFLFPFCSIQAGVRRDMPCDHITRTFDDPHSLSTIKIRATVNSPFINISYIVQVNSPIAESSASIYLRLLDKDGFEIRKDLLSNVVERYVGTLKGNFCIDPQEYQRIGGAELAVFHFDRL